MCGKLAMAYDRAENAIYVVLTERIVWSCLFNAKIITISYRVIEISIKSRYIEIFTMKNIKMYIFV